jgi:hypothetical protein
MDHTTLLRSTTVTQPTLNRQVAMASTPPQGSLTPEAFDRLLSSPPQPLSPEQEAHVAGVLQLMEEADRQFYSVQGSPVEPSSSGLLGPDFGPLPQSPAPFASPAYIPQTPVRSQKSSRSWQNRRRKRSTLPWQAALAPIPPPPHLTQRCQHWAKEMPTSTRPTSSRWMTIWR